MSRAEDVERRRPRQRSQQIGLGDEPRHNVIQIDQLENGTNRVNISRGSMLNFLNKPIIGMVHLPPLPGSASANGPLRVVEERALVDAERLVAGGVDALMMENFGDVPFFPRRVPSITATCMTRVARAIRTRFEIPLGINVLRNDGQTALAVAVASEAEFVRVNVLCGTRVTDQGVVQGIAHHLLRRRRELDADHIQILADVDVKHSVPLAARALDEEVSDTLKRGCADALIVSGPGTGESVEQDQVRLAKQAAGDAAVLVGSGVTAQTIVELAADADGFIVGTALKEGGIATNPVQQSRVEALVSSLRDCVK